MCAFLCFDMAEMVGGLLVSTDGEGNWPCVQIGSAGGFGCLFAGCFLLGGRQVGEEIFGKVLLC